MTLSNSPLFPNGQFRSSPVEECAAQMVGGESNYPFPVVAGFISCLYCHKMLSVARSVYVSMIGEMSPICFKLLRQRLLLQLLRA